MPILRRFGMVAKPGAKTANTIPRPTRRNATPGTRASLAMLHGHFEYVLFRQLRAREFAHNGLVPQNVSPVADSHQFRKFRTDHEDGGTFADQGFHKLIDLRLCSDIDTSC